MKTTAKTITHEQEFRSPKIRIHHSHALAPVAEFAERLCQHWGMVAGIPNGESSDGSAKLRLMTPEEVTQRAFDTAEMFFSMAAERGHLVELPDLDAEAEKKTESIAA